MATRTARIAKLTPPGTRHVVDRARLHGLLDSHRALPICWIAGPPGSGKTALAASYLAHSASAGLWMQIDPGDNDPATFFYFLRLAALKLRPKSARHLPLLTPEYFADLPGFARFFFRKLASILPSKSLVIFDDWHKLAADSIMHELLEVAIAEAPLGVRFLVASRSGPAEPFARLLANGQLLVLGWDALRLTQDETAQILNGRSGQLAGSAAQVHAWSRGWVSGLMLALAGGEHQRPLSANDTELSSDNLSAYFSSQVMRLEEADFKLFLIKTSVLPFVTAAMARELTGADDAASILERAYRGNLFTEKRGAGYQYHDLFRAYLQREFSSHFSEPAQRRLCAHAAQLLESASADAEAITLYGRAENWIAAQRLVLKLAPDMLSNGRGAALRDLVQWVLAKTDGDEHANWLHYWRGMSWLPAAPREARAALVEARRGFAGCGDTHGSVQACVGILSSYHFEFGDLRALDPWLDDLLGLLDQRPEFQSAIAELRVRAVLVWACMYRRPDPGLIDSQLERCFQLIEENTPDASWVVPANMLLQLLFQTADVVRGDWLVKTIQPALRLGGVGEAARAFWLVNVGFHQCFAGYRSQAQASFQEALWEIDKAAIRLPTVTVLCRLGLSVCAMDGGDFAQAQIECEQAAADSVASRFIEQALISMQRSRVAAAHRDWGGAGLHARRWGESAAAVGAVFHHFQSQVVQARVLIDLQRHDQAAALLQQVSLSIEGTVYFRHACQLDYARAYSALHQGDEIGARHHLAIALARSRELDYPPIMRFNPHFLQPLLSSALKWGMEVAYVQHLLQRFGIRSHGPGSEAGTWPLKIRCFGAFEVSREGQPLRFSKKAPTKTLQLLKAIIALGGVHVSETHLADALWPDAEGADARNALKTALARLRKILGDVQAVLQSGGRLSIDPAHCWVDALVFEERLGAAGGANPEPALQAETLSLYQGQFLAEEASASWAMAARDRYKTLFLRTVAKAGRSFTASAHFAQALPLYQRAVEVDTLTEPWTLALMECHLALGQRSEAVAAYDRLRQTLLRVRGTLPSAAVENLLGRLR